MHSLAYVHVYGVCCQIHPVGRAAQRDDFLVWQQGQLIFFRNACQLSLYCMQSSKNVEALIERIPCSLYKT